MAGAWTDEGPISLPSRPLAYAAGLAVVLFAVVGAGAGFEAAFRRSGGPELSDTGAGAKDDALIAKPIVDLAPPAPPPEAAKDDAKDKDDDSADADALAAQTAAAQAIQAKPASAGGDIDQVLTSPTEKPPTTSAKGADEAPPGTPVKSDVPF